VANGTLQLAGAPRNGTGADGAGVFDALSFDWAAAGGLPIWTTTFKAYRQAPPTIVLQQTFLHDITSAKGGTRFPDLATRFDSSRSLGALEYSGESCGFMVTPHGSVTGIQGGNGNGLLVVSPRDATGQGATASLAVGPVHEFFVNTAYGGGVAYGVAPTFEAIPKGFVVETALVAAVASQPPPTGGSGGTDVVVDKDVGGDSIRASIPAGGVNAALAGYGDFVLARNNKTRARGDINNITKYLGARASCSMSQG
jgi:hypothetical protein